MRQQINPILAAAYQQEGIQQSATNTPASNAAMNPILAAAYQQEGINQTPQSVPSQNENLNPLHTTLAQTLGLGSLNSSPILNAARYPAAGALNLLKQGTNLIHPYAQQVPGVGGLLGNYVFPHSTLNPLSEVGLASTPRNKSIANLSAGVMGALIPGPDLLAPEALGGGAIRSIFNTIPSAGIQAGIGAALDKRNRSQGAEFGALGSLIGLPAEALASHAAAKMAQFNEARDPINWTLNKVRDLISDRASNLNYAKDNYDTAHIADDYPLISQSDIPMFGGKFNTAQAEAFRNQNPNLIAQQFPDDEEMGHPIENAIRPGFGKDLKSSIRARNLNFGTAEAPAYPVQEYEKMMIQPNIKNALSTRKAFNMAKRSSMIKPSQEQFLEEGQNALKHGVIIPALRRYDAENGTNITDSFLAGDEPYSRELDIKSDKNLNALTSGKMPDEDIHPKEVKGILKNAIKNNNKFVQPGSNAYGINQELARLLRKAPYAKAPGKATRTLGALGRFGQKLNPVARTLALTAAQRNNQG